MTDLGVVLPEAFSVSTGRAMAEFAQAAEASGYGHLVAFERMLTNAATRSTSAGSRRGHGRPYHEPLALLAFLAGSTSRIELVTGVLVSPQRETLLMAKQAADVDLLSGGRLRFGVGVGWNPIEYDRLGGKFSERGDRLDMQVRMLRSLWNADGTRGRAAAELDVSTIAPRPSREIPIWFGGSSQMAFRRAAQLGDGFILPSSVGEGEQALRAIVDELELAGRAPEQFGIEVLVAHQDSMATLRDVVEGHIRRGATHVAIRTSGREPVQPDVHLHALQTAMDALGDLVETLC